MTRRAPSGLNIAENTASSWPRRTAGAPPPGWSALARSALDAGVPETALIHPELAASVAYSPDGTHLATGSADGAVRVWRTDGAGEPLVLRGHEGLVTSVAYSPDGTRIASGSKDPPVRVWRADGAGEPLVLRGHEGWIYAASFSPDGTRIVTGSQDSSVGVWDAESLSELAVLKGHSYDITYTAFSPDGERILSVGGAQGIVWTRLAPGSLPASVAGLWFNDYRNPGEPPLPPEVVRAMCVGSPIKIDSDDGLIVFFEATDPPQANLHVRCASNLTCEIFSGGSTQGAERVGEGTVTFSGDTGSLCLAERCGPIVRCPAITWTEEERSSGFADRWEASVQTPEN